MNKSKVVELGAVNSSDECSKVVELGAVNSSDE